MTEELFLKYVEHVSKFFKQKGNLKRVKLVSHLDADGISSAAILTKLLRSRTSILSTSILSQLKYSDLKDLNESNFDLYIFSDLGSGQIKKVREYLADKNVLILDHHEIGYITPEEKNLEKGNFSEVLNLNIIHVNPHLFGIDGGKKISGAGVSFFFASFMDKKIEEMAHIALVGAIGDVQDAKTGMISLNKKILDIAKEKGLVELKKDLRLFGIYSKPLINLLQNVQDPLVPYFKHRPEKTITFLKAIGIPYKSGRHFRYYYELSKEEKKRLDLGIRLTRKDMKDADDIYSIHYISLKENTDTSFKSLKEFATLLNGCGRLGKPDYGLYACLNDKNMKKKALNLVRTYKSDLMKYLNWIKYVRREQDKEFVYETPRFLIINGKDNLMHTMVGTLASILSKSKLFPKNKILMTMAYAPKKRLKISMRSSGNFDLREIFLKIFKDFDFGEFGGHSSASGAIIPVDKEKVFLVRAIDVLSEY